MDYHEKTKDELIDELNRLQLKIAIFKKQSPAKVAGGDEDDKEIDLEFQLYKAQKRLVRALEAMSDGFVCLDENWICTYLNQRAAKVFGKSIAEVLGKNIWEVFPEGIGEPFEEKYYKAAETGEEIDFEDFYEPWGRWFENRVIPTSDGLAIFFRDITLRKRNEETLVSHAKQLEINNQQLNDFCNIVSHNLRAPLVNLAMLSELISVDDNEEERIRMIHSIKPVVEHLNDVFNELVESLQVRQDLDVKSDEISLEVYFRKICSLLNAEIQVSKASIHSDFSEAPLLIYPKKYLESILLNLMSNAIKYRSPDRQLQINVSSRNLNGHVLLIVEDNGLGLDTKIHRENLFKIRKVFHDHPDARGFGLFMTKTQVEAMGGKIWMESSLGVGSKFFVELVIQKL